MCSRACHPADAIDYDQQDTFVQHQFGAIVVATGMDVFPWEDYYPQYGGGRIPDVISGLQYERMLNASGPTGGHVHRISNNEEPKTVVFIQCVGSRDESVGRPYCSSVCCMPTAKQAILTKGHCGMDTDVYVFYIDIRATGKGYEEFIKRAQAEFGVNYDARSCVQAVRRRRQGNGARGGHAPGSAGGDSRRPWSYSPQAPRRRGGCVASGPDPEHLLRRVRFLQGVASQAAPGGDQHGRCVPGRRLSGTRYPHFRGSGLRHGGKGAGTTGQRQA